jgi:hypothetical protein
MTAELFLQLFLKIGRLRQSQGISERPLASLSLEVYVWDVIQVFLTRNVQSFGADMRPARLVLGIANALGQRTTDLYRVLEATGGCPKLSAGTP